VQDKIRKVQNTGGDVWEDMKAGSELSWEAFDDSIRSAEHKMSKKSQKTVE
jgi:hypothetical protein